MQRLRDAGNSLVVVEHDPQIMLAADRILDMGPGPGERGGEIVFFGTPDASCRDADTLTGDYLAGAQARRPMRHPRAVADARRRARCSQARASTTSRTSTSRFRCSAWCASPACRARASRRWSRTCCTRRCARRYGKPTETPGAHRRAARRRAARRRRVGRPVADRPTTRSNPASYVGAFDAIRELFAAEPLAKRARLHRRHVQLQLRQRPLPDLRRQRLRARRDAVPLRRVPALPGLRRQALPRRDRSKCTSRGADGARSNIADVLDLTVTEALRVLRASDREVLARLQPLVDVGLDYLKLGQPVPTLSGGEAQRLKLAGHLAEAGRRAEHARRRAARCSCSTSRPPACTSTTSPSCCARSASCSTPATRCS